MLKTRLKTVANARTKYYDIFIPGSEIPVWFSSQTDVSSKSIIKMQLPPNFLNDTQFLGFAFCCLFFSDFNNKPWRGEHISYRTVIHGRNYSRQVESSFCHLKGNSTRVTEDHLWIHYLPCAKINLSSLVELATPLQIEVVVNIFGINSVVKKCGARIVHEKDLEEMDHTINEHSEPTSSKFDDIHSNDGSNENNIGAPVKRKWLNAKAGDQQGKITLFCASCQSDIVNHRLLS
ncbi:hypothetical protein ES319_A01G064100v1 [Gossypium barbadense]|nr:hypothetical protein ES319_A01G064100v1 [Gossypium barbadense]